MTNSERNPRRGEPNWLDSARVEKMNSTLNQEQIRSFFEHHLAAQSIPYRDQISVRCPFHDDKTPSLSINMREGVWKCHAGCGDGGMIEFEMKVSGCDREQAKVNVERIVGAQVFEASEKPEAIYQYKDANGVVQFEKVRYRGKRFVQRRPTARGYEYNLRGVNKPLYNLPEVITASTVIVLEGEKDCDNVIRAFAGIDMKGERVAVTTNFDGAGHWRSEYNPYFTGKKVIVIPDNDSIGIQHAENIANNTHPFACGVKIARLPGLSEHGDVSDFLQTHSGQELVAVLASAPSWYPAKAEQKLFLTAPEFIAKIPDEIDWLIDGVIQRGSNGMITAVPKAGKSWAALDMAIALALGESWLRFNVPRPVKVAVVSREDNPALTSWRLKHLFRGRSAKQPGLIESNLYVNTRQQSAQFLLDDDAQLQELIDAMHVFKPEFAIFDVFNCIHVADENDNSEMRDVLRQLSRIQSEINCGIGVVHHYGKDETRSMTQRLRGASAIAGWCEWVIGISMEDERTQTRRMQFELKAAQPPEPVLYRMITRNETTILQVETQGTEAVPIVRMPVQPARADTSPQTDRQISFLAE